MDSRQPTLKFTIAGMDCAEEVAILKRELAPLAGDESRLSFDILNGTMTVDAGPSSLTAEQIVSAVRRTGMSARLVKDADDTPADPKRGPRIVLTAISGAATVAGVLTQGLTRGWSGVFGSEGMAMAESVPWAARVAYGLAILAGVWSVLPKAWYALRRLRPDMNLLMVVAVAGAIALGEWFEGATVAFLFALSLALESWSIARARRAVGALMDMAPTMARIRDKDGERELPPEQVPVGSLTVVHPGEKIPLDGVVRAGESAVNQAPITGESMPVGKRPGEIVFAGTINGDGSLDIETTKPASDTTLARIVQMVGSAQAKRSPSEQWVEHFARRYTPTVMLVALAILVIPPIAFGGLWTVWLYRALVLLVIACPCALVISTPVSVVASLTAAAHNGVLIKGGAFVEIPARLKAIAFDKTGTLTSGRPKVVELVPLNGHSESEVLERAAALERRSTHPLAEAIVAHSQQRGVAPQPADEFQIVQGKGATGRIGGRMFWLGSHKYLEERRQETDDVHRRLEELTASGHTVVVVGNDQHVCGFIGLADTVRGEARESISALRALGIEHLIMLTGDNEGTARAVAKDAGVDEVLAELLPEDKVRAVASLTERYTAVAMVGDGVNDAPAMARSTLGIAMGVAGTDAAIEAADIALMSDDLRKLPWLVGHARRTLAIIRQNIVFSLVVKAVFVGLTFAGWASLWAAIAADTGASLVVISNGLRLLRNKDPR